MAAWAREDEKTSKKRQGNREVGAVDKVEVSRVVLVLEPTWLDRPKDFRGGVGCTEREA